MPIPMVVCKICGEKVTKRSTLSLSQLGSSEDGRICRSHSEVLALIDETKATDLKFGKLQEQIVECSRGVNYYDFMDALTNMKDDGTLGQTNDQIQHRVTRLISTSGRTIAEIREHAQEFIRIWREQGLID